jgi:NAD(P)-dependent dehydrogenase (short-subunit alcohol dehydrogenase family)
MLKEFKGKVAVITGAAGGIGRGLAEKAVNQGMKVVLADVEQGALRKTEEYLRSKGGDVLAVIADVSKPEQVEQLVARTVGKYGTVDLLCNNAGVAAGGQIREMTLKDWQWVLGVNLWGVIYGVHFFLPVMLKKDTESHIVNTASVEGLWTRIGSANYQVAKHGVVALSEILKMELAAESGKVGVSVLCPGGVNTGIVDAERNRPSDLQNPAVVRTPEQETMIAMVKKIFSTGMDPLEVANRVFEAVVADRFYILTHPELNPMIQKRLDGILTGGTPTSSLVIQPESFQKLMGNAAGQQ